MELSACICTGKKLLQSGSTQEREQGIHSLASAMNRGDREAPYILGKALSDYPFPAGERSVQSQVLRFLSNRCGAGDSRAAALLTEICNRRVSERERELLDSPDAAELLPFDRSGFLIPVKGTLRREGNGFVLFLRVKLSFTYSDDLPNRKRFERAVISGIRQWRGNYKVFGGVPLRVNVEVSRGRGGITVVPMTQSLGKSMERITVPLTRGKKREQVQDILKNRRSFASGGQQWSLRSRKIICVQSGNGFRDYKGIEHIVKHEFGHALGLDDLYESRVDGLPGVPQGTCSLLDCYHTYGFRYHRVMCDHHAPVCGQDLEMVLLAFQDNKLQLFQPRQGKGAISTVISKG